MQSAKFNNSIDFTKGLGLVEAMLGIALFSLVFLGLYAAFFAGLDTINASRSRVLATAIANEKLEEVRNLAYEDVGVENSYPTGTLPVSEAITREGVDFTAAYRVDYADDPKDGQAPDDACPNDYKVVQVIVSWSGKREGSISGDTIVAPRNSVQECNQKGGLLEVSVFNAEGQMVESPTIEVENIDTGLIKTASPSSGIHGFVLPQGTYRLKSYKTAYSSQQTYAAGDVYNGQTIAIPENPHANVLEGQLTERSLSIDKQSQFDIKTLEARINGNIYYVRKVGNDLNDGLSPDNAFASIQKAASSTGPGDMVFVGAGVYEEQIVIENSGTSDDKIIFVADTDGSFTGDAGVVEVKGNDFCLDIAGKQFVEIHGFLLSQASSSAVYIRAGASNIKIADNLIATNGNQGISIENSSQITIAFNEIYSNSRGLYLDGALDVKVKRNDFYNNATGTEVYNSTGLDFSFNQAYSNTGPGLFIKNSSLNTIKSNLIYNNGSTGIVLSNNSTSNTVSNNTLFQNQAQGLLIEQGSDSNTLENNIIASSTLSGIKVVNSTSTQHFYNDLWHNNPDYNGLPAATSSLNVDPLFVAPQTSDFLLSHQAAGQAQDSPLIDAGSDSAAGLGLDNRTTRTDGVPDGGTVDIGFHYTEDPELAYEAPQPFGQPVPDASCSLRGEKIVGKDDQEQDIYKYSDSFQTSATGTAVIQGLEWDQYYFGSTCTASGIDLDLLASWPSPNPITLLPDSNQEVRLGLKAVNTLLVKVKDSQDQSPVFSASVRLYQEALGYDNTLVTDEQGQAYFIPLNQAPDYILEVEASGYEFASTTVNVSGHSQKTIELTPVL